MANIPGAVSDPRRVKAEEIHFKSGGDSIPGYLAEPSQPGSYPGIVVIHEAFGLVEHERDIARRFANIGYNALAPNLYARAGIPDCVAVLQFGYGVLVPFFPVAIDPGLERVGGWRICQATVGPLRQTFLPVDPGILSQCGQRAGANPSLPRPPGT